MANLPENDWGEIPVHKGKHFDVTTIECTVKDLFTQTYGKMPESGSGN